MRTGRPSKYTPELLRKVQEYIDSFNFEPEQTRNCKNEYIPTLAGLSLWLNINRDTIHEWLKDEKKKDFSDLVSKITRRQEQLLVNGGLGGDYNPRITQLILNSKHDYIEKTQTDHKSSDRSMSPNSVLDAITKKHSESD